MTETPMKRHGGLHFRLEDGSVYFVRDEVLEACKLSGEELEGAESDLSKGPGKGKDRGKSVITASTYIEREMAPLEFSPIGDDKLPGSALKVAPTVMCCW